VYPSSTAHLLSIRPTQARSENESVAEQVVISPHRNHTTKFLVLVRAKCHGGWLRKPGARDASFLALMAVWLGFVTLVFTNTAGDAP